MSRKWMSILLFVGVAAMVNPAWSIDGKAIYGKKCKMCHSLAGEAGPMAKMGGALDDVGSKRDKAWVDAFLKNPKSKNPKSKMPVPKLTDEERAVLVELLSK